MVGMILNKKTGDHSFVLTAARNRGRGAMICTPPFCWFFNSSPKGTAPLSFRAGACAGVGIRPLHTVMGNTDCHARLCRARNDRNHGAYRQKIAPEGHAILPGHFCARWGHIFSL